MLGNLMSSAVQKGADYIKDFASIGLEYNTTMENYVTNFKTMLGGSSEAAEQLTGDLEDMAASTPFAMSDLADATQTLLSFGQDSSTVLDTLQNLGDISMGDAGKLQSLTLAFAQASSSGKLMGQDLMQMINAGFNPLQSIIDRTGVSMSDLKEFMSSGKASADLKKQMKAAQKEVKTMGESASDGAKLLAQMAEDGSISAETLGMIFEMETGPGGRFHNAMKAASETFSGMLSTLQDDSAALLGKVFKPISNWLKDEIMPRAQDFISAVDEGFEVGGLAGAWSAATGKIKGYLGELGQAALDVGSDLLADILSGITGDEVSGEQIKSIFTSLWSDVSAGLNGMMETGKGLLKGIADGLGTDTENGENIVDTLSKIWTDSSADLATFKDSATNLLGTIYQSLTGEEMTPESVGAKIGLIFKEGTEAMSGILSSATTYFNDVATALGDPDKTLLEKVGTVFESGLTAMNNIKNEAGHLFTDIYAALTGDEEGAQKIRDWLDFVFATPEEWKSRMEQGVDFVSDVFDPESDLVRGAYAEEHKTQYLQMVGKLYSEIATASGYQVEHDDRQVAVSEGLLDDWMTIINQGIENEDYDKTITQLYDLYDKVFNQEKTEGEGEEESDLSAAITGLKGSIDAMPGNVSASAAAALNGAKVEMDGQVVGNIVIATMSRMNRTTQKTYG